MRLSKQQPVVRSGIEITTIASIRHRQPLNKRKKIRSICVWERGGGCILPDKKSSISCNHVMITEGMQPKRRQSCIHSSAKWKATSRMSLFSVSGKKYEGSYERLDISLLYFIQVHAMLRLPPILRALEGARSTVQQSMRAKHEYLTKSLVGLCSSTYTDVPGPTLM